MNRRFPICIVLVWAVLSLRISHAASPATRSFALRVAARSTVEGRSIYARWVAAHFSKPAGRAVLPAEPAWIASLAIAGLEVSRDTSAGRYRQTGPVVTRASTGRQLVFWIDEKNGPGRLAARAFGSALVPLGSEFSLFGDNVEREPTALVGSTDGRATVLSWLNGQPYSIHSAFVDSLGTVQFEHVANESVSPPFVAGPAQARLFPRSFLVLWEEFRSGFWIVGQPFDSVGTRLGSNLLLDGTADTLLKTSPAVAGDTAGGYLVVWAQGDLARADIYVRLFDASHNPKGSAFAITAPSGSESNMLPAVTYVESTDQFHVVYIQADLPNDSTSLWMRRIARNGSILDSARALPAGPYPWIPHASRSGPGTAIYTARYDNLSEIRSLATDASGVVVDSTEIISTAVTRERTGVSASNGADTITVVWQDRVTEEDDIHGLERANGQTVTSEAPLQSEGPGGQQTEADVAGRLGGGVHVVYTDLQNDGDIALADVDEGGSILLRRRVSDDGLQAPQYDPHVASTSTGWSFITWTDERTDWPGPAVHAAGRFAQAGVFVAPSFSLSSSIAASLQGQSDVAMRSDKGSAVVWIDDRSGSARAYLRRFDGTGTPQGSEIALEDGSQSQFVIALERDPVVSTDSSGTIWAVWTVLDLITDSYYLLAQAWTSTGVRNGTNLLLAVLGPSPLPQEFDAAALGDGRLRLVWFDASSGSPAIMTAVFDSLGTVLEGPLAVSGNPISATGPCLAVDVSGRWAAGWSQSNGTSEAMVWQRFDASGTPTAGVEQISSVAPATRRRHGALTYAGSYLYGAWHDNVLPGKGYDVRLSSLLKASAAVDEETPLFPESFTLYPNYPNPFNGETRIGYRLAQPARVDLAIWDALGRQVKRLVSTSQGPGLYHVTWDGKDEQGRPLASGVYFFRLKAGVHTQAHKLLYMK